jgi:hypothetical protein
MHGPLGGTDVSSFGILPRAPPRTVQSPPENTPAADPKITRFRLVPTLLCGLRRNDSTCRSGCSATRAIQRDVSGNSQRQPCFLPRYWAKRARLASTGSVVSIVCMRLRFHDDSRTAGYQSTVKNKFAVEATDDDVAPSVLGFAVLANRDCCYS